MNTPEQGLRLMLALMEHEYPSHSEKFLIRLDLAFIVGQFVAYRMVDTEAGTNLLSWLHQASDEEIRRLFPG